MFELGREETRLDHRLTYQRCSTVVENLFGRDPRGVNKMRQKRGNQGPNWFVGKGSQVCQLLRIPRLYLTDDCRGRTDEWIIRVLVKVDLAPVVEFRKVMLTKRYGLIFVVIPSPDPHHFPQAPTASRSALLPNAATARVDEHVRGMSCRKGP